MCLMCQKTPGFSLISLTGRHPAGFNPFPSGLWEACGSPEHLKAMFPAHRRSFRAAKLLLGALIFLRACSCALGSSGETCYSRQHRDTIVNVHKALDHQKTVMDVRKKEAERDCILACCSVELKPGNCFRSDSPMSWGIIVRNYN